VDLFGFIGLCLIFCVLAVYLYPLFLNRIRFNLRGITLGKNQIGWQEILSISNITPVQSWSRPDFAKIGYLWTTLSLTYQFRTSKSTYTGYIMTYELKSFLEVLSQLPYYEVAAYDYRDYPRRWKKRGSEYLKTGMFDFDANDSPFMILGLLLVLPVFLYFVLKAFSGF
jgi:hypothetical protein